MPEYLTRSEAETTAIAKDLAGSLVPGDVLLLSGNLVAGKTAFVRGLAEGLGIDPGEVSSPTFTLVHEYRGGTLTLYHADLYRLDRAATDVLADLNLTAGAFSALLELGEAHPIGLAPSELARRLAVARRTATLYVDILARHGWTERHAHPDDRRMVLARLTPAGQHLLDDLSAAYKRRLAALLTDVTPLQAERLRQLLTLITVGSDPRDE